MTEMTIQMEVEMNVSGEDAFKATVNIIFV